MVEERKHNSVTANFMCHRGQALVPSCSVNIGLDVAGKVFLDVMNVSSQLTFRSSFTLTSVAGPWSISGRL